MPRRGSLGVHAERCSAEPWPGAVSIERAAGGAVAIRVSEGAVWGHDALPIVMPTQTTAARVASGDGRLSCEGGDRLSAPLAASSARARDQQNAVRDRTHQLCQRAPAATPCPGALLGPADGARSLRRWRATARGRGVNPTDRASRLARPAAGRAPHRLRRSAASTALAPPHFRQLCPRPPRFPWRRTE